MVKEKQLQSAIIEFLNYSGKCWVWKVNAGSIKIKTSKGTRMFQGAPKGHSDIQGMTKKGRFIALEVKVPKRRKNVSEYQKQFLNKVKMYGGISAVVTSPEEALEAVKEL